MIRVVLAVLLATGLLAVGLPAAETARSQHRTALLADEADGLVAAAERLHRRNDPVPPGTAGATVHVRVRVPPASTLGVEDGRVVWRRANRSRRVRGSVRLTGPSALGPGGHRLQLSLRRTARGPTVTVRRFKSGAEATPSRVRSQIGAPRLSL